ncbi:hypothetical protein G6F56_007255 [Rhizopus delemar]|nr:hypothetical protein G6F56_007255 [Rhizopus delemar]
MSAYHGYDKPRSPPAVPHHATGIEDQYNMQTIPTHSPYPSYHRHDASPDPTLVNNPHYVRESVSETKFMDTYNSDDEVPTVQFTGLKESPTITSLNSVLNMTFSLGITVDNPNFESITFEKISADAYYPSPYNVQVGGGEVDNVHIVSNGITNITFPFSITINSTDTAQQGVLMDLVTKCGLDGSTKQNIDFNYYVHPTVRIIGIAITPTISKSMSIACPLQGDDLTSILGSSF